MNQLRWRLQSDAPLHGLLALADGRIVASTHAGQTLIVRGGRYLAIWAAGVQAAGGLPPVVLGGNPDLRQRGRGPFRPFAQRANLLWQTGANLSRTRAPWL